MESLKIRNQSIDVFRYFCALMVVAIHVHPFTDVNSELGWFVVNVFPRIAVPYFFTIAGYFYFRKLEKGKDPVKSNLIRLIKVYSIWSLIYFVLEAFKLYHRHTLILSQFIGTIFKSYFIW